MGQAPAAAAAAARGMWGRHLLVPSTVAAVGPRLRVGGDRRGAAEGGHAGGLT